MKKDLTLEVFQSDKVVEAVQMHVYSLTSARIEEAYSVIRSAVRKIQNRNHCGVFENGKQIFTTEPIEIDIPNVDFKLTYEGVQRPDVLLNIRVYENYIKYLICKKLEQVYIYEKYRKYSCKNDITSSFIMTENGFGVFASKNKDIYLQRKYGIKVEIREDAKAYLWLNTGSVYTSKLTVADYLDQGRDVSGLLVKNVWTKENQSGIIEEVSEKTVLDKLNFCNSLKDYYIQQKQGYLVEKIPDNTPIINVKMNSGKICTFYPQALCPVLTREKVGEVDPDFSNKIDKYVKRTMSERIKLDQDFIHDIGVLEQLSNMTFQDKPCPVELLDFRKGYIEAPKLICANNNKIDCGQEYRVFNYGFYQKTKKKIKIGYLFPRGSKELMQAVVFAIYYFATEGKFHGEKAPHIINGLLDIQTRPVIQAEYDIGSKLDYKRAANELAKMEDIDMVISLVPDGMDDDNPYNPFKTIWAKANIPSQMITMSTAKLFANESKGSNTSKYYLHNIILGILGKTGGIPWIVKDMPGDVDLFVGLDVATAEKGIHYPACSVVFDKYGRLLGFYKPKNSQSGEKIGTKILEDIFTEVLLAYEEKFGEKPKNIVIHRDGFSNEDDSWYRHFFTAEGIEYSIVEVRKNISSKIVYFEDEKVLNPPMGYCVYNRDMAYLVTTGMKNRKGSPNPLLIEKKCGNARMTDLLRQILYLTQLHVGSTQKMRLPITTGYADKICKNREYVPEGKVDDKLFFL